MKQNKTTHVQNKGKETVKKDNIFLKKVKGNEPSAPPFPLSSLPGQPFAPLAVFLFRFLFRKKRTIEPRRGQRSIFCGFVYLSVKTVYLHIETTSFPCTPPSFALFSHVCCFFFPSTISLAVVYGSTCRSEVHLTWKRKRFFILFREPEEWSGLCVCIFNKKFDQVQSIW